MVYSTFDVQFSHTTPESETVRQNRRTVVVYGDSEFAIKAELERQNPSLRNIVILESTKR